MINTYIRPLSFDYIDAYQKKLSAEDVPLKFKEEPDDYQRRTRRKIVEVESEQQIVPYVPPPPPKQQNDDPCCACLCRKEEEGEICTACMNFLCKKCQQNPSNVPTCNVCSQLLCDNCKKGLKIKQEEIKLRSYPIKFKDISTLHFVDCKCKQCRPQ